MRRNSWESVGLMVLVLGCMPLAACGGRTLDRRAAQRLMARSPLGLSDNEDAVIESIQQVSAKDSIIETRIRAVLKVEKDRRGDWIIREVRVGDRPWERFEDLLLALDRVKADRTRSMIETIAAATARFHAERGALPDFQEYAGLADKLHPAYLTPLIRLDAWQRPFAAYRTGTDTIRLVSHGPDGEPATADDIVLERAYAP